MARRQSINFGEVRLVGNTVKVGTPSVAVLLRDATGDVLLSRAVAASKPTDGDDGYSAGSIFMATDTGDVYFNVGSRTTADFDVVSVGGATSAALGTSSVVSSRIADDAVTSAKIATGAVVAGLIGTAAVTSAKLATGAVVAGAIGTGAVTSAKLGALSVVASKIASSAVTATKYADASIIASKLKYAAVAVTVSSGATSGTAATSSGAVIIGFYPSITTAATFTLKSVAKAAATTAKVVLMAGTNKDKVFTVMTVKAA